MVYFLCLFYFVFVNFICLAGTCQAYFLNMESMRTMRRLPKMRLRSMCDVIYTDTPIDTHTLIRSPSDECCQLIIRVLDSGFLLSLDPTSLVDTRLPVVSL